MKETHPNWTLWYVPYKVDVPPEQKPYLDDVVNKIKDFLADESRMTLELPPSNAFQRKLVFQTVQNQYASGQCGRLGPTHLAPYFFPFCVVVLYIHSLFWGSWQNFDIFFSSLS